MGDTSWGGDLNSSLVPEHLCPCALHGNKVSPDPFLLSGAVAVLLFLLCCHGNAACIHPWSCLSPSCRSPVSCLQLTLGCFHPCSSLHPSLVLQPVSATRLLPRDFRGVLPSLPTLDKTLLRDERKGREEVGSPQVIYSVFAGPLLQLLVPVPRSRRDSSSQPRLGAGEIHQATPVSEWGPAKAAMEMRTAEILHLAGEEQWQNLGGTVTFLSPPLASHELPRFVQPWVKAELRLGCSCSFCPQTLIFALRYGMEMFDFTA